MAPLGCWPIYHFLDICVSKPTELLAASCFPFVWHHPWPMPLKQASAPPVCPRHFLTSGPESTFTPLTDTAFAVPVYAAFHYLQCYLNFSSILSLHSFFAIPTSTMSVYRDRAPPSWQLRKLQSSLQPKSGSHFPKPPAL